MKVSQSCSLSCFLSYQLTPPHNRAASLRRAFKSVWNTRMSQCSCDSHFLFFPDEHLNTLSLSQLGLKIVLIKGVIFNVLMTMLMWKKKKVSMLGGFWKHLSENIWIVSSAMNAPSLWKSCLCSLSILLLSASSKAPPFLWPYHFHPPLKYSSLSKCNFFFFQDISAFSFYIHPFPCLHSSIRFIPSSVSSWESLMVIDFNVSPNILVFAQCLFLLFLLPGHFSSTTVQLRL